VDAQIRCRNHVVAPVEQSSWWKRLKKKKK